MYKSQAQRRFFHSAGAKKAGITPMMVNEYDKASKGKKLPECLGCKNHVSHAHDMKRKMS